MKFNVLYCLVSGSALSDAHSDAIIIIVIGRLTSGDKVRICVERSEVGIKIIHIFLAIFSLCPLHFFYIASNWYSIGMCQSNVM